MNTVFLPITIDLPEPVAQAVRGRLDSEAHDGWEWDWSKSADSGQLLVAKNSDGGDRFAVHVSGSATLQGVHDGGSSVKDLVEVLERMCRVLVQEARFAAANVELAALRARVARQEQALRSSMEERGASVLKALEERRQREIESSLLAYRDPGTDVWRHGRFRERLAFECARSASVGEHVALLLADVDHLARINKQLGYDAGDELLQRVGKSLSAIWLDGPRSRPAVVGRDHGDRYAVLLPASSLDDAASGAEQVRVLVNRLPLGTARATVSVGGAVLAPGLPPDRLLKWARAGMEHALAEGGNRCRVCAVPTDPHAEPLP